ncbi:MAG: MucR family transcriptional regulator [Sphingomonadales bacterium]|nr:MucR family transcriptional regulator [Sphingomonadales bacterium]MDE2168221.1 MucR family transcriptional regulator [Sphingomonadales bacterium]
MTDETILTLTADIVSAHVSNNTVAPVDLPRLIESVYASLAGLGKEAPVEEKREPAVSIRSSVKPDALTCLECGTKMKMLKRHLTSDHGLTPAEYRARWSLPADYPMVAADYAARRKELAVRIGLGRKQSTADAPAAPEPEKKTRGRKKAAVVEAATAPAEGPAPASTKRTRRKKAETEAIEA